MDEKKIDIVNEEITENAPLEEEAKKAPNPVFTTFGKIGSTLARWFKRTFFGGANALAKEIEEEDDSKKFDVEEIVSPGKQRVKAFLKRKLAMTAVVILLSMFVLVFVGPIFSPYVPDYMEESQKNIAPGLNMMSAPGDIANQISDISSVSKFSLGVSKDGKLAVWGDTSAIGWDVSKIPDEVKNGKVAFASAGSDHAVAVLDSGKVVCWGNNNLAQYGPMPENDPAAQFLYTYMPKALLEGTLDVNQIAQVTCGTQVSAIVMKDGKVYMWGNYNNGAENMSSVKAKTNVKKIVFTNSLAVALLDDGTVSAGASTRLNYITYKNSAGEIVKVTKDEYFANGLTVVDIAAARGSIAMVMSDGSVAFSGTFYNNEQIMPELNSGEKVVSISAGKKHYTAVTNQGNVYSWGDNNFGQADAPKNVEGVDRVISCSFQNYALDADGKIIAKWGLNGYLMGTDGMGRDIWNRILNGGRLTMTIGAISVIISSIIGIIVGCLSGYFGGWVDMLCMRLSEIVSSIPFMPFALILSLVVRQLGLDEMTRIFLIMVVLGVLSWPGLARLVRAQVLSVREQEFVTAAKAMGVKEGKIAFKHILPNIISIIIVTMTLDFAGCMLTESSLSYLGFGVQLPRPTWGNMLNGANNSVVIQNFWWQWLFPAVFLMITTICINIIGDALRDVMDPKSSAER